MGATYGNRTRLTRETTELRPRRITRQEKNERALPPGFAPGTRASLARMILLSPRQ